MRVHDSSVLFITLDSCRYDTFDAAHIPNMRSIGPLHKAQAPSYFTFGSHSAMFVGFTPGVSASREKFINPKYGKIFRLTGAGFPGKKERLFELSGPNIVTGFNRLGYLTIGSAAVPWFDPATETGQALSSSFRQFFYSGNTWSLSRQLAWLRNSLESSAGARVFVFLNVGETHVPYYFEDAAWSRTDNPCIPFQAADRVGDCRYRQRACLEFVDRRLAELLSAFSAATTVICADHGDCWGEDGLWEHGISHEMTLTVPLILRIDGQGVGNIPE